MLHKYFRKRLFRSTLVIGLLSLLTMFLSGCGSNSGGTASTVITGTVATGAAVIGTVTVKDSSTPPQTFTKEIEADGSYSVDVNGMTAPFIFRASGTVGGRTVTLHSAATEADISGTINITPFTDLIVANMAQVIAENFFDNYNPSADSGAISADSLNNAEADLQVKLQPVLAAVGIDTGIDLLRAAFSANHTGLDAVLDVIRVTPKYDGAGNPTGVMELKNLITNDTITDDVTINTDNTAINTPPADFKENTDAISHIADTFDRFTNLFTNGLPSAAALNELVSDTFLEGGETKAVWVASLITDPSMRGVAFENIVLESIDKGTGVANVTFTVKRNGRSFSVNFNMKLEAGIWKLAGDGRKIEIGAYAEAKKHIKFDVQSGDATTVSYQTGINFNVDDDRGLVDAGTDVTVTGPGLPDGGLPLTRNTNGASNYFYYYSGSGVPNYLYTEADGLDLSAIPDNAVYEFSVTVEGTTKTYTEVIPKKPLALTEIENSPDQYFSTVSLDPYDFKNKVYSAGSSVNVSWTAPSSLNFDYLSFYYDYSSAPGSPLTNFAETDVYYIGANTSTQVTIHSTMPDTDNFKSIFLEIDYVDAFQRDYMLTWEYFNGN